MQRIAALEQQERGFGGYAVLDVFEGQTIESCKADWIAENGPVGNRQWVVFNFGGLDQEAGASPC